MVRIQPVILCGGSGTRLWPLSRPHLPKQYLPLVSDQSLFQETLQRLQMQRHRFADPIVIANAAHGDIVRRQLAEIGETASLVVLEPMGRNTAPAVALAAALTAEAPPGTLLLCLHSDHHIADPAGFYRALDAAEPAARAGYLTIFGIEPTRAETGFGYIERGAPLAEHPGVFRVARFVEKPPLPTAEQYLATGRHTWNSGMFLFRRDVLADELKRHCPHIVAAVTAAAAMSPPNDGVIALDAAGFAQCASEPIDTALMERTTRAAMVPASMGWSDVGSFAALAEIAEKDADGNVARGNVVLSGAKRTYARSESRLIAALGTEDLVIVETGDSILVAALARLGALKNLVEELEATPSHATGVEVQSHALAPGRDIAVALSDDTLAHFVATQGTVVMRDGSGERRIAQGAAASVAAGWSGMLTSQGGAAQCLEIRVAAKHA